MSLYDRIFKPHVYTLADGTAVEEKRSRAPLILLVLIALTVLSVRITGFDLAVLVKKGSKFFDILKAMFPPNTAYLGKIWQPLWDTIKMSILGSFVGAVLAVPFAVAAASNIVTNRVVVFLVRLFLSLVRTLPTLVCALIATYIFGLGTMAGTCAIAVFTFAYVGKQLFEIIETVDMAPLRGDGGVGRYAPARLYHRRLSAGAAHLSVRVPVLSGGQRALRLHPRLCGRGRTGPHYE